MEEVREEEIRLGDGEIPLNDEAFRNFLQVLFIEIWRKLEQALISKFQALEPNIPVTLTPEATAKFLLYKGFIDQDLVQRIVYLYGAKNLIIHTNSLHGFTTQEINVMIAEIRNITQIISQLPTENTN